MGARAAGASLAAALLCAPRGAAAGPAVLVEPARAVQGSFTCVRVTGSARGGTVEALGGTWPLYPAAGGWRTLVPVPLGAKPGRVRVRVELKGGRELVAPFRVDARERQVIRAIKGLTVGAADAAALNAHKVVLSRALRTTGPVALWTAGPLRAPVPGPVTSPFGVTRSYGGTAEWPHRGADFGSPAGWPVIAPAAGVVVLSRQMTMYGNIMVLDHGQGVHTSYLHMTSRELKEGQRVEAGQVLGTVGATGFAKGAHLHFGTYIGPVAVDPLDMLQRGLP